MKAILGSALLVIVKSIHMKSLSHGDDFNPEEQFDAMVELDVMTDNKQTLWEGNFDKYKESRPFDSDCDVNERQNWLGVN